MGLFSSDKGYIGVDIGNSSIKMVELEKKGKSASLVNYAFSETKKFGDENNNKKYSGEYLSALINKLYKEGGFKATNAVATLPTSSVFSSVINLSNVDKSNLDSAVQWEAKKVIPTSLDEMALDWQIIEEDKEKDNAKVFLTGSPKKMIEKYISIFKKTDINLSSLETEIFSLIRSLDINSDTVSMIVELGTVNTDISIIKQRIPVLNRSINTGGLSITKAISESLNVSMERAEKFKYDLGIKSSGQGGREVVPETITKTLKPVIDEVEYMVNLFENNNEQKIENIILAGGSAFLPHLTDHMAEAVDKNVIMGDPWYNVSYPDELKDVLYEMGPRLGVAIGSAMRGVK